MESILSTEKPDSETWRERTLKDLGSVVEEAQHEAEFMLAHIDDHTGTEKEFKSKIRACQELRSAIFDLLE